LTQLIFYNFSNNKVREIAQGANWSKFTFDADRRRITQFQQDDTTMIYVGEHYEKVIHPSGQLIEEKHYIMTPFGRTAVRTVRSDGKIEIRYFHQDALGSINAVTDEYGRVEMRFAYDPWGKQTVLHDNRVTPAEGKQTRGYTDHEMLQDLGLIHMNARVYDPAISRFLSADRVVQDIGNSQSYNRYSYCINNPVNATDPTGNEWSFMDFLSAFMSLNWYDPYEAPPDDNQGGGGTADPKTDGQSTVAKNAGVASQGNGDETSTQARSLLNQGDGTSSGTVGIQAGGQGVGSAASNSGLQNSQQGGTTTATAAITPSSNPNSGSGWFYRFTGWIINHTIGFKSADSVARWALKGANPRSIRDNVEYDGLIYERQNGRFGYSTAIKGDVTDTKRGEHFYPEYAKVAGAYHTHGDYTFQESRESPRIRTSDPRRDSFDSDNFGSIIRLDRLNDIQLATEAAEKFPGFRAYLGTPSGVFKVFDPAAGITTSL
jgi:RHS repeat-associated protein